MKGERPPWLCARGPGRQPGGAGEPDTASPPGSVPASLSPWAPLSLSGPCRRGVRARRGSTPGASSNRNHHNDTAHLSIWGEPLVDQESLPNAICPTRTKSGVNSGGDFTFQFWWGWGSAKCLARRFTGGPQRGRGFSALGTPARGRTKPSCPRVLSARVLSPAVLRPAGAPSKMLPELLD